MKKIAFVLIGCLLLLIAGCLDSASPSADQLRFTYSQRDGLMYIGDKPIAGSVLTPTLGTPQKVTYQADPATFKVIDAEIGLSRDKNWFFYHDGLLDMNLSSVKVLAKSSYLLAYSKESHNLGPLYAPARVGHDSLAAHSWLQNRTNIYYDGELVLRNQQNFMVLGSFTCLDSLRGGYLYAKNDEAVYAGGFNKVTEADPETTTLMENSCGYLKDAESVFYQEYTVKGASAKEAVALSPDQPYLWTANAVYYQCYPISGADPATFALFDLSQPFGFDKKNVYYKDRRISRADKTTFVILDGLAGYAKDSRRIYCGYERVPSTKPETFQAMGKGFGWAWDADTVYFMGDPILDSTGKKVAVDTESFAVLGEYGLYAKDKHHVFSRQKVLAGIDPATFTIIDEDRGVAGDKENIFVDGKPIAGADPGSFTLLSIFYLRSQGKMVYYAKDAAAVFFDGIPMEKADPATFTACANSGFGKDAANVFFGGNVLEGADASSFRFLPELSSRLGGPVGGDDTYIWLAHKKSKEAFPGPIEAAPGSDSWFYGKEAGLWVGGTTAFASFPIQGKQLEIIGFGDYATDGQTIFFEGETVPVHADQAAILPLVSEGTGLFDIPTPLVWDGQRIADGTRLLLTLDEPMQLLEPASFQIPPVKKIILQGKTNTYQLAWNTLNELQLIPYTP